MTIYWRGTPEAIHWAGEVQEVYHGSQLLWPAEELFHTLTVPSTVVEYFNWPGMEIYTEPAGPGSVYRVVPDITYTPNASLTLQIERRHWRPDPFVPAGGVWLTDTELTLTAGESEARVTLYPGDSVSLHGVINGAGTSTIAGSVALYRREDAEPRPPLFPASGSFMLTDQVTTLTEFGPPEGSGYLYVQEIGTYRVTIDLPDDHNNNIQPIARMNTSLWAAATRTEPHPPGKLRYQYTLAIDNLGVFNKLAPVVRQRPDASPIPATIDWMVEQL